MKSILYSVLSLISVVGVAQSQIGPGGVGTSANLEVWLDASQMTLSDGDPVSTWSDVSGNGNDFTQATSSRQPTFIEGGAIGGRPTVAFDGGDQIESAAISDLDTDEVSWFVTYVNNESFGNSIKRAVLNTQLSTRVTGWGLNLKRESNLITRHEFYATTSSGGIKFANSNISSANQLSPHVVNGSWNSGDYVSGRNNGLTAVSTAGADASVFSHVKTELGYHPSQLTYFNGEIPEVIVFSEVVNSAQEKIIINYLSAKYDNPLSDNVVYDNGANYGSEVAGIGRDDASNQHLSAKGTGIVEIVSAGLDNADFLMWGHDDGGYATVATNVPSDYASTGGKRLTQTWKVSEIGEVGEISLSVDLTGITFGDESDYELLVSDDNDFSDATRIVGTFLSDVVTFTVGANELEDDYYFTIGNNQREIVSIVDGQNWNQPSTWSCTCVPDFEKNVVIRTGHTVTVTDDRDVLSLEIESGGELILDANTLFTVKGDVNVDGILSIISPSKMLFDGSIQQYFNVDGVVTFDTLELDNSNGLEVVTGTFSVVGAVIPTDGVIDFNDNNLTFLSTASGSAYIGAQGVGATLSGLANLNVQKYIPSGDAGMRNVSFPYNESFKLNQWDDELFISGTGFPDGCAATSSGCYFSATYWDASTQGYKPIANLDSVITVDNGVEIFLGDNLNTLSAKTITTTGPGIMLDESVDIPIQTSWNFVANPFLAPIDWDDIAKSSVDIGNYFYVYDASIGGFQYWDGDNQTTSAGSFVGGVIPPFQGYWVFNSGASSFLTVDQSCKSISTSDNFVKENISLNNNFQIKLKEKKSKRFSTIWLNNTGEKNQEVPRLPKVESAFDWYASVEGSEKELNVVVADFTQCMEIDLMAERLEEGEYEILFNDVPSDVNVSLYNSLTKSEKLIKDGELINIFVNDDNYKNLKLIITPKGKVCSGKVDGLGLDFIVFMNEGEMNLSFNDFSQSGTVKVYSISGELLLNKPVWNINNGLFKFNLDVENGTYLVVFNSQKTGETVTKKFVVSK